MPPNHPNSPSPKPADDVICIADQFHFSSFYSSTNLAGLADDDDLSVNTPTPSSSGKDGNSPRVLRSDSVSIILEDQANGSSAAADARLKPHTIANPDRVKLKFYSNVLGDNSTFIHYVSSLAVCSCMCWV